MNLEPSRQALQSDPALPQDLYRATLTVEPSLGIHARLAAQIVHESNRFPSAQITICFGEKMASCSSINALLLLSVKHSDELTVCAQGPSAQEAVAAVSHLLTKEEDGLGASQQLSQEEQRQRVLGILADIRRHSQGQFMFRHQVVNQALGVLVSIASEWPEAIHLIQTHFQSAQSDERLVLGDLLSKIEPSVRQSAISPEALPLLFMRLDADISASSNRLALFGALHAADALTFASAPYYQERQGSLTSKLGGFFYSGPTGMYSGMHAMELMAYQSSYDCQAGLLRKAGFVEIENANNGGDSGRPDTTWKLEMPLALDGRARLNSLTPARAWLRGTLAEPCASVGGFLRLDPPLEPERFLQLKYGEQLLTPAQRDSYPEVLLQEYRLVLSILATGIEHHKPLVLPKEIRRTFEQRCGVSSHTLCLGDILS